MCGSVTQRKFFKLFFQPRIGHQSWTQKPTCAQCITKFLLSGTCKFGSYPQSPLRSGDEDTTLKGVDQLQFRKPGHRQECRCLQRRFFCPTSGFFCTFKIQVKAGQMVGVRVRNHAASSSPANQRSSPAVCSAVHFGMPRTCRRSQYASKSGTCSVAEGWCVDTSKSIMASMKRRCSAGGRALTCSNRSRALTLKRYPRGSDSQATFPGMSDPELMKK